MPALSTPPNQHQQHYVYYHPQSAHTQPYRPATQPWPHHRPSDDRSDPRSLSSDTSMSVSATMSPVSSQDESVALPAKVVHPAVTAQNQCACDWGEYARQPRWDGRTQSPQRSRLSVYSESEEEDEEDDKESENAVVVLLRLSFLAPPFSLVTALYTLFVLLFLVITTPVRLCFSSAKPASTLPTQILHLLLPLLHRHQRLITTLTPSQSRRERHPYHRSSDAELLVASYSPTRLLLIHLLSPLLILPILFAAWTAAFFWIFAIILGNPDGTERRDDGRAAVLGVRNWWRAWLRSAEIRGEERGKNPEMKQAADAHAAARV